MCVKECVSRDIHRLVSGTLQLLHTRTHTHTDRRYSILIYNNCHPQIKTKMRCISHHQPPQKESASLLSNDFTALRGFSFIGWIYEYHYSVRCIHKAPKLVCMCVSVRVLKCINIYSLERDDGDGSGGNAEQ